MKKWGLYLLVVGFYSFTVGLIASTWIRKDAEVVHKQDSLTIKELQKLQLNDSIEKINLQKLLDKQDGLTRKVSLVSSKLDTIKTNTKKKR